MFARSTVMGIPEPRNVGRVTSKIPHAFSFFDYQCHSCGEAGEQSLSYAKGKIKNES